MFLYYVKKIPNRLERLLILIKILQFHTKKSKHKHLWGKDSWSGKKIVNFIVLLLEKKLQIFKSGKIDFTRILSNIMMQFQLHNLTLKKAHKSCCNITGKKVTVL